MSHCAQLITLSICEAGMFCCHGRTSGRPAGWMGGRAAEAKSLYSSAGCPDAAVRRESLNMLTGAAARRDDGTFHARSEVSYRIQLKSVLAGTRPAACWTLPRLLAGRDWTVKQ